MAEHWMKEAFGENRGALHRELHVPEDQPIPASKLQKAEHSSNPLLRKRAVAGETGARIARAHARKRSKATAAQAADAMASRG